MKLASAEGILGFKALYLSKRVSCTLVGDAEKVINKNEVGV
jgi:hypothetical protein